MNRAVKVASAFLNGLQEKETPAQKVVHAFLNNREASAAEREVEKLFKDLLPGTPYANKTHAVGGYVRDQYISELKDDPSIDPKDLDIVIEMDGGSKKLTHFIKKEFGDTISTPVQMGTYPIWQITFKDNIKHNDKEYKTKGAVIEVADTMSEQFSDDKSRQREVKYAPLKDDIERRDFTVNMLLKDLTTGEIKDLTGTSKADIEKGVLKHVDKVMLDKRFKEDPLRLMRLIRFAAVKEWDIPKFVLRIAKKNAERIKIVSKERIMAELKKTMETGKLKQAIRLMDTIGVREYILPEINALKGVEHDERHHQEGDVYKHTLKVLENAKPGIENQMAALLHDVGKPEKQQILADKITFLGHQEAGAEMARAIMKRLKFDKKTTDKVVKLIKRHMDPLIEINPPKPLPADATPKQQRSHKKTLQRYEVKLRKYIRDVGDETIDSILDLARADELGRIPAKEEIPTLIKEIEKVRKSPIKVDMEPLFGGKELMKILDLKPGPDVKDAKELILRIQDQYASRSEKLTEEKAKKELYDRWRNRRKQKNKSK